MVYSRVDPGFENDTFSGIIVLGSRANARVSQRSHALIVSLFGCVQARGRILNKFADLMEEHTNELAAIESCALNPGSRYEQ